MCSRAWVTITFFCLILVALRVHASGGPGNRAEKKKTPDQAAAQIPVSTPSRVRVSWDAVGIDKDSKVAERLALEEARTKVLEYLEEQNPLFHWKPDLEYVEKNLIKGEKKEQAAKLDPDFPHFDNEPKLREVTLSVEVTDKSYHDMLEQDRKLRDEERKAVAKDRQTLLGKLLAGLLAGLIAIAAYLRLDEATKGYYTTWLRLASVALVATIGAGVWLLL